MKTTRLLAICCAAVLAAGSAFAVPASKTLELDGGAAGKVTFSGKAHADKGLKCADCHSSPKLFPMSKGKEKMTMADINAGKFCGACHDGKKAFKASDAANCSKCHKK